MSVEAVTDGLDLSRGEMLTPGSGPREQLSSGAVIPETKLRHQTIPRAPRKVKAEAVHASGTSDEWHLETREEN